MVNPVVAGIDDVLSPLNFVRRNSTWNRRSGAFIDVISLQVEKAGESATLNLGVMKPNLHRAIWGQEAPQFVDDTLCTVRARIGQLVGNRDLWWELSDARAPRETIDVIASAGLPFLERMHSPEAMETYLDASGSTRQRYPLPAINLALLKYERGARAEACQLLNELRERVRGAWLARIQEVAHRIECP